MTLLNDPWAVEYLLAYGRTTLNSVKLRIYQEGDSSKYFGEQRINSPV